MFTYVSTCYVAQNMQPIYESIAKLHLGRVALSTIQEWYQKDLCNGSWQRMFLDKATFFNVIDHKMSR